MPTLNSERFLRETLESLVVQNDKAIECIVVDGGSSDGTLAIIDEYKTVLDIRLYQSARANWCAQTNLGLERASADYVCMLHHDDLWHPGRAVQLRAALRRHPDVVLLLHPTRFIDEQGRHLGYWKCPLEPEPRIYVPVELLEHLLVQNFVALPALTFNRAVALKVGGLEPDLWYTGDWDFYLKLAQEGTTVYLNEVLASFRVHGTSLTMKGSANTDAFRRQLEHVLAKHLPALAHSERFRAVARAATASVNINVALAATLHGSLRSLPAALKWFVRLGPRGWSRYLKDSRIHERAFSRLRLVRPRRQLRRIDPASST
jgi:GT2 family glycosyltransferase